MDQSTHDVRRANWLNIITECQQRPAGVPSKIVTAYYLICNFPSKYTETSFPMPPRSPDAKLIPLSLSSSFI